MNQKLTREVVAEFLGTFILILGGVGVVAQVVLSGENNGDYLSINLAWGLSVTMAVYVAGGVSGAHLNPAVTLAMAVFRGFSWRKVLPYCLGQLAGAFAASVTVFATYHEALDRFDGGTRQVAGPKGTAGIWATYPQDFLSAFPGGFIDQTTGTALLVLLVFALTDRRNKIADSGFLPVMIGATVVLVGMAFGFNSGYAINPARDFGPRLFTAMAGWGSEVFRAGDHWWWVPVVGPCFGALVGGFLYDFLMRERVVDVEAKTSVAP